MKRNKLTLSSGTGTGEGTIIGKSSVKRASRHASQHVSRVLSIVLSLAIAVTFMPAAFMLQTETASAAAADKISNPKTSGGGVSTWSCVYFGSYPQTEIVSDPSQCGTYSNSSWGKSSDYKADSSLYTKLQNASYDINGDTTISGTKYRRIKKSDATYSTSSNDSYYNWSDSSTYHYFRYDKIKWRVLEKADGYALILADKALDDQKYNMEYKSITWETSTIRSWLNGYGASDNDYGTNYSTYNFIDTAFSSSEQSAVRQTSIENADNLSYGTEGGNDTSDKIFLLSESDVYSTTLAASHGFNKSKSADDINRRAKTSTYAKAMGTRSTTSTDYAGNCWWWLRSPGYGTKYAAGVGNHGNGSNSGNYVNSDDDGVRPALYLNLSSSLWSYAGTVTAGDDDDSTDTSETKSTGSAGITEDDLFEDLDKWGYLAVNKIYNRMLSEVYLDLDDIIYVDDEKAKRAAKATALKGGVVNDIISIIGGLTGNFFTEKKMEEEVALDLLQAIGEDDYLMSDITSQVKKQYKAQSDVYKMIEYGTKSAQAYKIYSEAFANNYSKDQVLELMKSVDSNWKDIDKVFSNAGVAINSLETAVLLLETRDTNMYTLNKIMNKIENDDSALHRGLMRIYNKNKGTTANGLVNEWIKNDGFEIAASKGLGALSGAFAPAEFAFKLLGYGVTAANGGVDMGDIDKAFIALSNDSQMGNAVYLVQQQIFNNNKKGGDKDYSDDFKFFKEAQFKALDVAVQYAQKVGTKKQVKKLNSDYNKYKDYFNIESYLKSCVENANANWSYKVENGKAKITGVKKGSAGSKTGSLADKLGLVVYAADSDAGTPAVLNIPEEVDGYEVASIDEDAFNNDSDIEFVSIPSSVEEIGSNAFKDCSALKSVFFEKGVTTIGDSAFSNCENVTDVSIPVSVEQIGDGAFAGNDNMTIYAIEDSAAGEYADSADITFETVEAKAEAITVETLPDKTSYTMSESEIDTDGIKVTAEMENGESVDVSDDVYCYFGDKQLGTSKINVAYDDVETSFDVEVTADECKYTVKYENELGDEIADEYTGTAMAGKDVDLPIPDVDGYTPEVKSKTITIGDDNDYLIVYAADDKAIKITDNDVSVQDKVTYTGDAVMPEVKVTVDGKTLKEGTDYEVVGNGDKDPGTSEVLIIGEGDYTGSVYKDFNIIQYEVGTVELSYSSAQYTGRKLTPEITVTGSDGKTLTEGKDYTISYPAGRISVGEYEFTATGLGNYTGSASASLTIKPVGTTLKKLKKGKKSFTVKWKKQSAKMATSRITGYQIRYSTDASMEGAKAKTVKGYKKTSAKIKKLAKKKKYYVQIRTYMKAGGKTCYSAWSSVKTVKTK